MKKFFKHLACAVAFFACAGAANAQLSDEEYSYVTMDLRGILDLTMTTDPQVDFVFESISDYTWGITKFNAVKLEVDATVAWDLFAYATTDNFEQVESYSTNGTPELPAEILEIKSSIANTAPDPIPNFNDFARIKGLANSGVDASGNPDGSKTQFLAGGVGKNGNLTFAPGTAAAHPTTNQFRLDYKIKPGIPAEFGIDLQDNVAYPSADATKEDYAQAGYYYLEIVYSLVEDL